MNFNIILVSLLVFLFRMMDLYITKIGIKDFQQDEQNLIVKMTGIGMETFFVIETILAFLFVICYWYYLKYKLLFSVKANNFKEYINIYFFNKSKTTIKDWFMNLRLKQAFVLFGSSVPVYVITTSILFSINNLWSSLYNENNQTAIKYYLLFDDYYFFDFIIFVFPPLLLLFLLNQKMYKEFKINHV